MPLTQLLGDFFVVVLAASGSWLALQGLVSVGTIAAFVNYGHNFTAPLRQVSNLYNSSPGSRLQVQNVCLKLSILRESRRMEKNLFKSYRPHNYSG